MMRKRRTPTIATLDEPGFQHLSTATNHYDRGNTDNHRTSTNVIPFMAIAIVSNTKTTMTIQSTTTNMSKPNIKNDNDDVDDEDCDINADDDKESRTPTAING